MQHDEEGLAQPFDAATTVPSVGFWKPGLTHGPRRRFSGGACNTVVLERARDVDLHRRSAAQDRRASCRDTVRATTRGGTPVSLQRRHCRARPRAAAGGRRRNQPRRERPPCKRYKASRAEGQARARTRQAAVECQRRERCKLVEIMVDVCDLPCAGGATVYGSRSSIGTRTGGQVGRVVARD